MTKNLAAAALALALVLPALASASDINPGALQLSGKSSFGIGSQTVKTDGGEVETSTLGGGLSAMYYVSKFLAFGLATEYDKTEVTDTPDVGPETSVQESLFFFGPKAGLDYELMDHLSVFADLTVGMAQMAVEDYSGNGFGFEVGGGFRLFLNNNVSLDLMGSYKRVSADVDTIGTVTHSGFGGMIGFSVYLTNNPSNSERAVERYERSREREREYP
jgi:opacity protein-like surface antigen